MDTRHTHGLLWDPQNPHKLRPVFPQPQAQGSSQMTKPVICRGPLVPLWFNNQHLDVRRHNSVSPGPFLSPLHTLMHTHTHTHTHTQSFPASCWQRPPPPTHTFTTILHSDTPSCPQAWASAPGPSTGSHLAPGGTLNLHKALDQGQVVSLPRDTGLPCSTPAPKVFSSDSPRCHLFLGLLGRGRGRALHVL